MIDFIEENQDQPFIAYYSMALCHAVANDFMPRPPYGPKGRYQTYGEMVKSMDEHVGKLIEALERLDLRRETVVIFTADNGSPSSVYRSHKKDGELVDRSFVSKRGGTSVRGGKGGLDDGGTNVPLILNWPGRIEAGQVVDDLIDFSDFLPTFLELAGASVEHSEGLDGQSFAGLIEDRPHHTRDWAYSESGDRFWVRSQRWKLCSNGRFYDLSTDPYESMAISEDSLTGEAAEAYRRFNVVVEQMKRARQEIEE